MYAGRLAVVFMTPQRLTAPRERQRRPAEREQADQSSQRLRSNVGDRRFPAQRIFFIIFFSQLVYVFYQSAYRCRERCLQTYKHN